VRQLGPESGERRRVVLAQVVAQLVDEPLPAPNQVLVSAGQHLQGDGQLGVAGHRSVVVPIGAHQVRQHLGVAGIRFGPGRHMAFPVATRRQRIDRIDLVTPGQQRADQ